MKKAAFLFTGTSTSFPSPLLSNHVALFSTMSLGYKVGSHLAWEETASVAGGSVTWAGYLPLFSLNIITYEVKI